MVAVIAVFEVPPFLAAKTHQRKTPGRHHHGGATTPPIFPGWQRSRIQTALAESRSGNLHATEEEDEGQRRQHQAVAWRHRARIGRHRIDGHNESASTTRPLNRDVYAVGP